MTTTDFFRLFDPLYDDLITAEDFPAVRPLLAHYTSLENLEKIVASDEIWFSNPLVMNDLEEVRFGILRGSSLVYNSEVLARSCGTEARAALLRKAFEDYFDRFEDQHAFDTYVFCLSEHAANDDDGELSMWRGYGGNGGGAAIVFDTKQIDATDDSPLIVARVHYGSTEQRLQWLDNRITKCGDIIRAHSIPDDKLFVAAYSLFERIKLFSLFSKHKGFREEREWRVVYTPDRDPEKRFGDMFHYSIGPRGAEPRLRMKISPMGGLTSSDFSLVKIIERIILGPTLSSPLAVKAVHRMLERLGKTDLKSRIRASTIPFRPI